MFACVLYSGLCDKTTQKHKEQETSDIFTKYHSATTTIFEYIEKAFTLIIIPLYHEIKTNLYLNLAFVWIILYYVASSALGLLEKMFKSKKKFVYNAPDPSTPDDVSKQLEKLTQNFNELSRLADSLSQQSQTAQPATKDEELSKIWEIIQKQQKTIDGLIKESHKLHSYITDSQSEIVESLKVLGGDVVSLMSTAPKSTGTSAKKPLFPDHKSDVRSDHGPAKSSKPFATEGDDDSVKQQHKPPKSLSRKSSITSLSESMKDATKNAINALNAEQQSKLTSPNSSLQETKAAPIEEKPVESKLPPRSPFGKSFRPPATNPFEAKIPPTIATYHNNFHITGASPEEVKETSATINDSNNLQSPKQQDSNTFVEKDERPITTADDEFDMPKLNSASIANAPRVVPKTLPVPTRQPPPNLRPIPPVIKRPVPVTQPLYKVSANTAPVNPGGAAKDV
jgi:hypothetical protein